MKSFSALLLLFCFISNNSYCQKSNHLTIPNVKESVTVDSLIEFILRGNATILGKPSNYRWIIFDIQYKGTNNYHFTASKNSENFINFSVNRLINNKTPFGYFKYKNFYVYLLENKDFDIFYKRTSKSTVFSFLHKLKNLEPTNEIKMEKLTFWDYDYKNGRVLPVNAPTLH